IDLKEAYQQVVVTESASLVLTVNTHKGLFRVTRMPYGISIAPKLFQRYIDGLLKPINGVKAFLDDILITGKSEDDHYRKLVQVLTVLREAGLNINLRKCRF